MAVTTEPEALDAGVIEEARRRQRRHRFAAGVAAAALAAILALAFGGGAHPARPPVPVHLSSSFTWLSGPPLTGVTHLRLIASENTGPAFIVDVDSGTARIVSGLGVPRNHSTTTGPQLYPLTAAPGGALAVVTSAPCQRCTSTEFFVGVDGSVRRVAKLGVAGNEDTAPAFDSTATWVLARPRGGRCTLRLVPSSRPAVAAPCGSLRPDSDTPAGLMVSKGSEVMFVDPRTGRIRARVRVAGAVDVLSRDRALTSTSPGFPSDGSFPTGLTLVDLASGSRTRLAWPSVLHFGYTVLREPHGSLVAVEFADPAYPSGHQTIGQAADIWMLDPGTGVFTHVPAFPILEHLKFSSVAWSADGRLIIVAQGGAFNQPDARTVIGVWRPGERSVRVRAVPALDGYSQFVALTG